MKKGDIITIPGRYRRRSLWQWLTKARRELQPFVIVDECVAGGIAEYTKANESTDGASS